MVEDNSKVYTKPTPIVVERKIEIPPTVIVDNNSGFILYRQLPDGYKNTSFSYSNIKECMGLNFYCSNESIGVSIFRNGVLYSITDILISDFFTVTLSSDAQISLISAIQLDDDLIYIAAIANVSPAVDKILFSSKTISYKGLLLSCPTTIEHVSLSTSERSNHNIMYNSDGSFNSLFDSTDGIDTDSMQAINVDYVTYENYNGSHGFGDINIVEINIGDDLSSAMKIINTQVSSDIAGLNTHFSTLVDYEIYAIESFRSNGALFVLALSEDSLYEFSFSDTGFETRTMVFRDKNEQIEFTNVHFSPMKYLIGRDLYRSSKYDVTYAPAGVFKRLKSPESIIINRIEHITVDENIIPCISIYTIKLGQDTEQELLYDNILSEAGTLIPSSKGTIIAEDFNDLNYVFYSSKMSINAYHNNETIAALNRGVVHESKLANTYPNQKVDIITVKSMCNFMDYGSPSDI